MKRCSSAALILLLFVAVGAAQAALLPEALGEFTRKSVEPATTPDKPLFDEFGFEEAETGVYETNDGRRAVITATRYYDDTGAYSAFEWLRAPDGQAAEHGKRAWKGPDSTLIQLGNYLVEMSGDAPVDEHVELMLAYLPKIRVTVDPPVLAYVPQADVVPGTERHILGPVALERLAPEVSPSAAGFNFGAEAHFAEYRTPAGPTRMLLFSYPTPQMAREQVEQMYKVDGVVAKRTGPLIAAVVAAPSADEAQRLLAKVRYEAEVTMDYAEPKRHDDPYLLLMDIAVLCGILVLLCIAGGLLVGGGRILAGKVAPSSIFAAGEAESVTRLHIED
ncbi:MAG: hypothetical protein GC160_02005 [Acidobacteria bacterium]|nr:hypothetical protein [Acidobacteriota bacterium]